VDDWEAVGVGTIGSVDADDCEVGAGTEGRGGGTEGLLNSSRTSIVPKKLYQSLLL